MIEELVDIIHDSIKRSITAMALNKLLLELTTNYIDSFHKVGNYIFRTP